MRHTFLIIYQTAWPIVKSSLYLLHKSPSPAACGGGASSAGTLTVGVVSS